MYQIVKSVQWVSGMPDATRPIPCENQRPQDIEDRSLDTKNGTRDTGAIRSSPITGGFAIHQRRFRSTHARS